MSLTKLICPLVLFAIFSTGTLLAQSLSPSGAETIAEFLYLDNVLSEEGKEELKFRIGEDHLEMPSGYPYADRERDGTTSRARILHFLAEQYGSAYAYRQGAGIRIELMRNEENGFSQDRTPEQDSLLDLEVHKQLERQAGYRFEQQFALRQTDTIAYVRGVRNFFPSLRGGISDRFVPSSRSGIHRFIIHPRTFGAVLHRGLPYRVVDSPLQCPTRLT